MWAIWSGDRHGPFALSAKFCPRPLAVGNPETSYLDGDAGATKTFILEAHRRNPGDVFWHYCFGQRGGEELYDLGRDPDCLSNLADRPASDSERSRLRTRLLTELKAQGDPRRSANGDIFDRYEPAQRGHVGFYEKFRRGERVTTE